MRLSVLMNEAILRHGYVRITRRFDFALSANLAGKYYHDCREYYSLHEFLRGRRKYPNRAVLEAF